MWRFFRSLRPPVFQVQLELGKYDEALLLYRAIWAVPDPRAVAVAPLAASAACLEAYLACRLYLGHAQRTCTPPETDPTREVCTAVVALQESVMRRTRMLPTARSDYEEEFIATMRWAAAAYVALYEEKAVRRS